MRLTTSLRRAGRLDHALRALVALDGATAEHPCKLGDLLERSPAPRKFLAHILGALTHGGLVGSTRGNRGGYWVTRPLSEITVLDVIEALGDEATDGERPDTLTALWDAIDANVRDLLGSLSLADLGGVRTSAS